MPGVLEQTSEAKRKGFWKLVWEGLTLAAKSPYILLAYLGGFVARGDSIIVTLFLPLWINTYFIEHGLCPDGGDGLLKDGLPGDPRLHRCGEAFTKSSIYGGIAQTCALVGAPLFGFLADRFESRRSIPLLIASIVSFVAYFSMFFLTDPIGQAGWMYPLLCLVGFGEIGMIVTSLCLVTSAKLVQPDIRGSVAGCYSLMGVLGLLVSTKVGGWLFDSWRYTAPFLVISILGGITMLGGMMVVGMESWRHWRNKREGSVRL